MTRILIVEDERIVAWSIREILQMFNYEVVANVTSGPQAIQIAVAAKPDLILMDVRLEGEMDGITATQRIQMQIDIPVVYLTAYADDQTLNQAVATAPFGYIVKPFTRRSLRAAVETALYRHQSEQQLKASQQWFMNTFNSLGDAAIATNAEGQIMFMNAAAEELTGWEQAEALGKPADQILDFIHAQSREAIENSLLQAIRDGVSVSCLDNCMLRTKDGVERAIGDSATPIKTAQGEIIGGVMVFQDITERWQAEQALQTATAGLEQQVHERTAQLQRALEFETVLKCITDRLRDSLDEAQILQAAVEELVKGLGIRGGDTGLFNFEKGTLDIRYEYTVDQSSLATEIPLESYSDVLPWLQAGQSLQFCEDSRLSHPK
jgi:PAS domain S-box-containing protein